MGMGFLKRKGHYSPYFGLIGLLFLLGCQTKRHPQSRIAFKRLTEDCSLWVEVLPQAATMRIDLAGNCLKISPQQYLGGVKDLMADSSLAESGEDIKQIYINYEAGNFSDSKFNAAAAEWKSYMEASLGIPLFQDTSVHGYAKFQQSP